MPFTLTGTSNTAPSSLVEPPGAADASGLRRVGNVDLDALEARLQCRLQGRVRNLRVTVGGRGLVLSGQTETYHAKQLVQHAAMEATALPIGANEIEVYRSHCL